MSSLAQATDAASADDRARHGLKLTGQACHWPSARRGRPEPSAAFVQIAFLAYLGFGQRLRARRFHRLYPAAALIPPRVRGMTGLCASDTTCHVPVALARSIRAWPCSVIRPSSVILAARSRFTRLHVLRGLRG